MSAIVHKRKDLVRTVKRTVNARTASEAVGAITHGCEIFGISKGNFSLVDLIAHCLTATGPARVLVSTWTAANADLGFAYKLLADGAITDLQLVVDFSFPTRQPEYCAAMREKFGDHCIRVTKTHAKFVVIRNADWNIVIRSSMNLNENRRLESFEVSDDHGMAEFCEGLVKRLFAEQADGVSFANRPYDNVVAFERFGEDDSPATDELPEAAMASTDTRKYFGAGRYSPDLRRAGLTRT